jgi:hypothetical protein
VNDVTDGKVLVWCGRKLFQKTVAIVRSAAANELWKTITYKGKECMNICIHAE